MFSVIHLLSLLCSFRYGCMIFLRNRIHSYQLHIDIYIYMYTYIYMYCTYIYIYMHRHLFVWRIFCYKNPTKQRNDCMLWWLTSRRPHGAWPRRDGGWRRSLHTYGRSWARPGGWPEWNTAGDIKILEQMILVESSPYSKAHHIPGQKS